MNEDRTFTQEEIDALLSGEEEGQNNDLGRYLSSVEVDAIGEVGNISFGSSATALSELLNQKVEITTPSVAVVQKGRLADEFPRPHVAIFVKYTSGFEGSNVLVMKTGDARIIADLMMGGNGMVVSNDMGEMEMSAVQEAMNQMMGSASTAMSAVFSKKIDISPPSVDVMDFTDEERIGSFPDGDMLKVSFRLKVGELIDSNIMQLLPIDFAKSMVRELINTEAADVDEKEVDHQDSRPSRSRSKEENDLSEASHSRQVDRQPSSLGRIQSAVFSDFEDTDDIRTETQNLNMLFDIPLQVTVELGRAKRTVKDILRLSPGSVVELDKLAGEPVDIYVNDKLLAKGEVVVIDENFGVRVTEIASQKDRIQKIK
jgi:flagellar motor switch protein FliN/FliY